MKWGQNLLLLKCQRSLPVGFGGSKTVGRDRIGADTWHSLAVLFGSEEEGNRLSTGRAQPRGSHTALTGARAGDMAQHDPAQGLAGGTQSLTWTRGQTGTATPQAAICWAHAGGNIHEQAGETCIGSSHSHVLLCRSRHWQVPYGIVVMINL